MNYLQIGILIGVSFGFSAALTALLIPVIKRLKAGQNIREDGPQSHLSKAGTPSMGGIAIILATVAGCLISGKFNADMGVILGVFLAFGMLGFFDDFLKVLHKQNMGLNAKQKMALQIGIAIAAAVYQANMSEEGTHIYVPFCHNYLDLGIFYIPFVVFVVVAMVNSVNLTDGLDGLSSGVTAIVALFFVAVGLNFGMDTGAVFSACLVGGCLGFLLFNKYPAKIFMGDTGSLALGGGLAAAAIIMKMELLLPVAGLLFVLEALSVILQVVSFKTRGKRIFKMAPLHHHFELSGFKETKVVLMFWGFTIICCILGMAII